MVGEEHAILTETKITLKWFVYEKNFSSRALDRKISHTQPL